jgi:predicted anti-sigma-YlaC factor YlaD
MAQAAAAGAGARPVEMAADAAELDAARWHLGRCPACRALVEDLALTIVALGRLTPVVAGVPPSDPDGTWDRLRSRIARSRSRALAQAWRWRSEVAGLLGSALLVAIVVGPGAIQFGGGPEPGGFTAAELRRQALAAEAAYGSRVGTLPRSDTAITETLRDLYVNRPDGIRQARKEVAPTRTTARTPDAR